MAGRSDFDPAVTLILNRENRAASTPIRSFHTFLKLLRRLVIDSAASGRLVALRLAEAIAQGRLVL
jgi:hypothetical protein